jgi:hypothetical protein
MMLIQDEKEEEARVLRDLNKPHPGLHGLLKKNDSQEEGDSLLGGNNYSDDDEELEEKDNDKEKEDNFSDELAL